MLQVCWHCPPEDFKEVQPGGWLTASPTFKLFIWTGPLALTVTSQVRPTSTHLQGVHLVWPWHLGTPQCGQQCAANFSHLSKSTMAATVTGLNNSSTSGVSQAHRPCCQLPGSLLALNGRWAFRMDHQGTAATPIGCSQNQSGSG